MTINVGEVAMAFMNDIQLGKRVREEMGDLTEIEKSMKKDGLIQPLAVKQLADGKYSLLAGGRRFTILNKNDVKVVPIRIYPENITEYEVKSIEMAENFHRKDLEYWEYDNLIREIDEMEKELHGAPAYPGGPGHRMEDTGNMIGVSKNTVSNAIQRANARDAYPVLFEGAKTQQDASKIIKKVDEVIVKEQIARKLEASKTDSKVNQLSKCYILGDFFEKIKEIDDKVFHLVEIDSPYAIAIKEAKKREGESRYSLGEYNEIPASDFMDGGKTPHWLGMNTVFKECYRVMVDHSWMIVWFGPEPWFGDIYNAIIHAGFETTRMCPIWTKPSGQSKRPEMHLPNSYEMFFYAWKGRPAIAKARGSNQFDYSPVPPTKKTHPTERPIELMKDIYETFAFPGSRILIPFLGSGSGLLAADALGMSPLGFELGKSYRDSFLVKVHNMTGG